MSVVPSPTRPMRVLPVTLLAICLALLAVNRAHSQSVQPEKARLQLRTAATASNEVELQKVETAFPGSQEAALARLARGYLRLQAKDYQNAIFLLKDPVINQRTALGDYAEYYLGQALQGAGRFDESEREFLKLREAFPSSTFARAATLQAAGSRMNRGSYQAAIDALAPLIEAKDGTALKLKADASNKLDKPGEEIAALR